MEKYKKGTLFRLQDSTTREWHLVLSVEESENYLGKFYLYKTLTFSKILTIITYHSEDLLKKFCLEI